jgi:signal transduction histidine kinase
MRTHIEGALSELGDPERTSDQLHDLLAETTGILETFNALLRIGQIESGVLRDELAEVDLAPIVRDAVDLYAPVAEQAGLSIDAQLEAGVTVRGDRHLLAQALTNLIDNAVKYSEAAGCTGAVEVSAAPTPEGVVLSVRDRGPGVPAPDRERVLTRFVRLDSSRHLPGTGLGLSFVAAVARLHGADLRLEDAEPGLRATLRFPPQSSA